MRQSTLVAHLVELLTTKSHIIGAPAGKLSLPISECAAGFPMSPDRYYHGISARHKFDVLRLFRVNHIIEHVDDGAVLVEHRV